MRRGKPVTVQSRSNVRRGYLIYDLQKHTQSVRYVASHETSSCAPHSLIPGRVCIAYTEFVYVDIYSGFFCKLSLDTCQRQACRADRIATSSIGKQCIEWLTFIIEKMRLCNWTHTRTMTRKIELLTTMRPVSAHR